MKRFLRRILVWFKRNEKAVQAIVAVGTFCGTVTIAYFANEIDSKIERNRALSDSSHKSLLIHDQMLEDSALSELLDIARVAELRTKNSNYTPNDYKFDNIYYARRANENFKVFYEVFPVDLLRRFDLYAHSIANCLLGPSKVIAFRAFETEREDLGANPFSNDGFMAGLVNSLVNRDPTERNYYVKYGINKKQNIKLRSGVCDPETIISVVLPSVTEIFYSLRPTFYCSVAYRGYSASLTVIEFLVVLEHLYMQRVLNEIDTSSEDPSFHSIYYTREYNQDEIYRTIRPYQTDELSNTGCKEFQNPPKLSIDGVTSEILTRRKRDDATEKYFESTSHTQLISQGIKTFHDAIFGMLDN